MTKVHVSVPATAANLGPGYDCFGLAMARYDEVSAQIIDGPVRVDVTGVGAGSVPLDETHLVLRAAGKVFDLLGEPRHSLWLECINRIPHGGGQGSSAAATVAGMLLARALVPGGTARLDDADLLALATDMEGHPDNVAPALFGGLTISWTQPDGTVRSIRRRVHQDVRLGVFTASAHCSTKAARDMLPGNVSHGDAVKNSAAVAVLLHALTEDPVYLWDGTVDLLHQQYREPAMPASAELVRDLRKAGIAAVVSGAGPSVLALLTEQIDAAQWRRPGFVLAELAVDSDGAKVTST